MAQDDENVVILEEAEFEQDEETAPLEEQDSGDSEYMVSLDELEPVVPEQPAEVQEVGKKSKKKLFVIGGAAGVLALILTVVLFLVFKSDKKPPIDERQIVKDIEEHYESQKFGSSKIDDMIAKANLLYEKGNKFEALKIYENIAIYNQSLSSYNLGVSQMRQGKFKEALESFKKAIANDENVAVSAINAAVSSLELKNEQNFNYYINLANSFLYKEADSPLYNYYYALINYYKGQYIEALAALAHAENGYYKDRYDYLAAKILSFIGDDAEAIKKLEAQKEFDADLALGMLYARLGQYDKARNRLNLALNKGGDSNKINAMIAIINLKDGKFEAATNEIKAVFHEDSLFLGVNFPIKTILKPELFDVNLAQAHFRNDLFFDKTKRYETLFYFAPYKVFDPGQTINYIRKGGVSLFLDDASAAGNYLNASGALSKVNLELSSAIANALNYKLKQANEQFASLISLYPEHSVLHYDLALSYAQLGNFSMAAKHFITSYHLDPTNHLAGVLGAIANDINAVDNAKLLQEISENLGHDANSKDAPVSYALIALIGNNSGALVRWLEEEKEETALNLAFDAIIAKMTDQSGEFIKKAQILKAKLPDDIVANILNFIANFKDEGIKKYVEQIQIYFHDKRLNDAAFYHGANIIKEQYIKLLQISGLLNYEREKIKTLLKRDANNADLLQTLAYIDIFTNDFEESYRIYNRIIDEFKINDAGTLFLAAVAAIGSNHPQNATALLELSKLTDPNAMESRIALGHLYQEIDNIEAATIQYGMIKDPNFKSKFVDFMIDYTKEKK
ncbi:tetratricopeptide repeat protein [Campylobacter rectus]|uniref:tetratricopeptide repeat protein n=1 Tax=Campylobacter rectus TaxID=203 RepID=UPI000F5E96F3|nr:tetratricopeptide repeat protein [Campylobacter rectus]RRD54091.1 tetratricopeptide repeat protein [Campylobacter rectus]